MEYIQFQPRWKEEIVASSRKGVLVFEMTMGINHVYFPTELLWLKDAPEWAKPLWKDYAEQCEQWCRSNRVPFTLVDNTYMYEERK